MLNYSEMKKAIQHKRESSQYFTAEFYDTFIAEYRQTVNDIINGNKSEHYLSTKQSDFYNKNSGAYCVFLEIFENSLPKFRVDYYTDAWGSLYKRIYEHAENFETMHALAIAEMKEPVKFIEVMEVA
jgi:hypothetical protein